MSKKAGTRKRRRKTYIPEYRIWCQIRQACSNPNDLRWDAVGARGIRLCPEWDSFSVFLKDVGRRPSRLHYLRRHDLEENYTPGNTHWRRQKGECRRPDVRQLVTMSGVTKPLGQWAEVAGLSRAALRRRLSKGGGIGSVLRKPRGKLTPEDVLLILKKRQAGWLLSELADEFNVSVGLVCQIARGFVRTSVTGLKRSC